MNFHFFPNRVKLTFTVIRKLVVGYNFRLIKPPNAFFKTSGATMDIMPKTSVPNTPSTILKLEASFLRQLSQSLSLFVLVRGHPHFLQ
jgi:hypothetical protein